MLACYNTASICCAAKKRMLLSAFAARDKGGFDMNYYAMSDIHGFYDEMQTALKECGYFEDTEPKKIVICGDLFDRGNQTKEVQDFVVDLLEKDGIILIRGNHEDLLEELVQHLDIYGKEILLTHHLSNGTANTLAALTLFNFQDFRLKTFDVKEAYYKTPFYKQILPAMQDCYETTKYIFVHGWIPCEASGFGGIAYKYQYMDGWRDAPRKEWEYARWYNGIEAARQGVIEPGKTIVCGHWNASYGNARKFGGFEFGKGSNHSTYFDKGIIALDACTVVSQKINCVKLTDE